MLKKIIDKIVFAITKKPKHYVEVKNPPKTAIEKLSRPQDARQMQYNRWSRRYKIYSGSYLPENDNRLMKKGWALVKSKQNGSRVIQRKSTGQTVVSDWHGDPHHYHWYDYWGKPYVNSRFGKVVDNGFRGKTVFYNKYGKLTHRKDPAHHIQGDKKDA